ncbi:hyaluronan mediated motility receptor [Anabrus simplex]|uniref:hyaluronan mediated motility receptor n=1 Tax=Anabrus simplex TaxID=316456 RepID=UPI0035A3B66A
MSFPRAKIQRFNDGTNSTPAPGSYDPKFGSKVKGAIIEKSGRFTDKTDGESPAAAVSKASSMNCLPVFRTPQLPRKTTKVPSKTSCKKNPDKKDGADKEKLQGKDLFSSSDSLDVVPLKTQIEEMTVELNVTKEQCKLLESTISSKLNVIQELEQNNELLGMQMKELQDNLLLVQTQHRASLEDFEKYSQDCLESLKDISSLLDDCNFGFQEDLHHAREELAHALTIHGDLEQKINQKQQMILLLQGELSSSEVELVECKSECERMIAEITREKDNLSNSIKELEEKREKEREETFKQIQTLKDNLANEKVIQEHLKLSLGKKEEALKAMEIDYDNIVAECQRLKALHKKELLELTRTFEARLSRVCLNLEEGLKNFKNSGAGLNVACNQKLQALEERLADVYDKAKICWENEIARLEKQMKSKVEELQSEVTNLKTVNEVNDRAATSKIQDLERDARIITEKLLRAEEELRRTCMTRDEMRVSNMEYKLAIVELQDKLDTITVERNAAKESLSDIVKDRDLLKGRNKMLEVGNHNLSQSLEALKQRLLESECDVEKITLQKEALENEIVQIRKELSDKCEELEDQRENLAKVEAANLRQIEEVRNDLLMKVESLKLKFKVDCEKNHHLELLKRDFQQLSVYTSVLERQVDEQEQKLKTLEQLEKNLHESQIHLGMQEDAYNSLSANFNKQSVELQHSRTELSLAQNKIATQEEQILEFKCTIEQLSQDVEGSEMKILELNEVVNNLEETTAEQEKEIEALNEKLDHQRDCAKAATQQITNLSSELECHKNFSHQATEHLMNLTNTNSEQQKQIHCLTIEIEELKSESREMECRLQDISFELTTTQQNARESAEQIKALEGLLESREKQLQELARNYEQECKERQRYMARIAVLEDSESKKQQELSEALNKVSALSDEKVKLEKNSEDLERWKAEAEKVKELQTLLAEAKDKESQWKERYLEVYSLIGPFKEQLEAYRAECQHLEQEKGEVVGEIHKLAEQYADILGHQNHKQKIRHLVKLKDQNFELKEEVQKLKRTVDKLQKERATNKPLKASVTTPVKGKENHTPSCKSLQLSPSTKPFSQKNAM